MFYLTTHSTHFIYGYMASDIWLRKEGNVLFNDALNTFYLRLYGAGHIREDSESERKPATATRGLLLISSKGSFICTRKEILYLTTHSTHFIYGYMVSDIWLRTIPIARKETHCRHIGYSLQLTARIILYAPSHRQDSTYHNLCYTSRGALAGTRNSSMGSPHEGSIRRPIAP